MHSTPLSTAVTESHLREHLSDESVRAVLDSCKAGLMEELHAAGCTDEGVAKDLLSLRDPLIHWAHGMVRQGLRHTLLTSAGGGVSKDADAVRSSSAGIIMQSSSAALGPSDDYHLLAIDSCEETVCSRMLGLKGQVDMVAFARMVQQQSLLPIELKTGRWKPSTVFGHRAQVILYSLMLSMRDRCGIRLLSEVSALLYDDRQHRLPPHQKPSNRTTAYPSIHRTARHPSRLLPMDCCCTSMREARRWIWCVPAGPMCAPSS